jgi:hypothetical protein
MPSFDTGEGTPLTRPSQAGPARADRGIAGRIAGLLSGRRTKYVVVVFWLLVVTRSERRPSLVVPYRCSYALSRDSHGIFRSHFRVLEKDSHGTVLLGCSH